MVQSSSPSSIILSLYLLLLCNSFLDGASAFFIVPTKPCVVKTNSDGDKLFPDRNLKLRANKDDGYKFGDITRGVLGKFQKDVNSVTGKSKYEFGDFSRWLDQQGRGKVSQWLEGFTNNPDYEFGDLSREVLRRLQTGQYSSEDVWLFLRIVALVGVNMQPVAMILPLKVVVELLEVGVAQQLSDKVIKTLTSEVDSRMKEFVTGDKDYKIGDFTKKAVTGSKDYQFGDLTKNAIKNVDGKGTYQFGDITRKFLNQRQGSNNESSNGAGTKLLDIDAETEQALEDWDKEYLAAKRDDAAIAKLELETWDEKFLDAASKEGNSENKNNY